MWHHVVWYIPTFWRYLLPLYSGYKSTMSMEKLVQIEARMMWNSGPPFLLSIPFLHTQLSVLFWWQTQKVSLQPLYLYQTTGYHIPEHGNLLNHNSLFSGSDIQPVICLVWNRWAKHYTAIFCDILRHTVSNPVMWLVSTVTHTVKARYTTYQSVPQDHTWQSDCLFHLH